MGDERGRRQACALEVQVQVGVGVGEHARRIGPGRQVLQQLDQLLVGAAVGAIFATLTELILIRPLYERHIEQVLVTVGLSVAAVALFEGIWGTDAGNIAGPPWHKGTSEVVGARIPKTDWVLMLAAALVLGALDDGLNENAYIVPGLGDAGDRLYGTAD